MALAVPGTSKHLIPWGYNTLCILKYKLQFNLKYKVVESILFLHTLASMKASMISAMRRPKTYREVRESPEEGLREAGLGLNLRN